MIKNSVKRLMVVALGSLLVSSCSTYSLEELRHTTPKGSAFQNILAKMYMDFADLEEKDYDWQNSWYFADKGLLAAYGKDVVPEDPENWNLPAGARAHIEKGRADLLAALTPEMLKNKPEIAARAQFNFDCWVEQQEENWQKDDIEACRDGFIKALAKLDSNDKKLQKKASVSKKHSNKQSKKIDKRIRKKVENRIIETVTPSTTFFMVVFEPNVDVFTSAANSVLSDIAKTLAAQEDGDYEVVITDKSAGKKDNLELSLERIQAVKNKLIEAGIKESAIMNGSRTGKQINHRIEIFLND